MSGKARCDDTASCKTHAPSLAPEDMRKALNPVIQKSDSKCEQGFNHAQLALMIAPMSIIDKYRKEEKLDR